MGFAGRMANVSGTNVSENGRKTSAVSGRDNYVGWDAASIYGMGVYSRKDCSNGRVMTGGEIEQAGNQKSESKTEIIVKPDGSRVLVMTMSIGGMETTMSLEISKPTKAPNENSKQDTDNNMPSANAEMDTVSDEMSNISNEA